MSQDPAHLTIQATPKTPYVHLDRRTGRMEFKGRSIPEDSIGFFRPILDWIQTLGATDPPGEISVRVEMEYFNTSSSKCFLDVFRALEAIQRQGSRVEVQWIYEEEDEEMLEMGEDFSEISDLTFRFTVVNG